MSRGPADRHQGPLDAAGSLASPSSRGSSGWPRHPTQSFRTAPLSRPTRCSNTRARHRAHHDGRLPRCPGDRPAGPAQPVPPLLSAPVDPRARRAAVRGGGARRGRRRGGDGAGRWRGRAGAGRRRRGRRGSLAVCLLFSFANPEHERCIGERGGRRGLEVSLSSEILPEFREFERTSTTVLNAYVSPLMARTSTASSRGSGRPGGCG